MKDNNPTRAALYIRVSTERQVQEGYSISAQKTNLTKFANDQGWSICGVYADKGISAKNIEDRPNVKRLIKDIKDKKIDVVVLYKFDRLTRDMSDTEDIIKLIQQYEIGVYTISGGTVDVTTASGRFMVRMNGAIAQLEREQTIERVKMGFIEKVRQGKSLCGNTASYGYDRPKHQEIQSINKKEAKVVKRIFKMYTLENKTFTEIANILNAEGIPTKLKGRVRKKPNSDEVYTINSVWQPKTIRLMLSNITYIGGVRYGINKENGFEVLNGLHEPIISQELWDKTQKKLGKIKKIHRTNHPKDDVYYSGILVCGYCGRKLTTQRTIKTHKDGSTITHFGYRCLYRERGQCIALGMSHKKVEEAFLTYIDSIEDLSEIDNVNPELEKDETLEDINDLKKRISQIESKKKEIMNLFMEDEIAYNDMKYMTSELDKKLAILKDELTQLEKKYQPVKQLDKSKIAKTIKEHWQFLTNRERLEFLNQFVKEIDIINRDKDKVNGKAEIIEVKWYDE